MKREDGKMDKFGRRVWIAVLVLQMLFGAFIMCALNASLAMEPQDTKWTIMVTGSTGEAFSGTYGTTKTDGSSSSKSVDGVVPQTYDVSGKYCDTVF